MSKKVYCCDCAEMEKRFLRDYCWETFQCKAFIDRIEESPIRKIIHYADPNKININNDCKKFRKKSFFKNFWRGLKFVWQG
jgi:hypothetical protein